MNGQPVTTVVSTNSAYDHASRPVSLSHAIDGDGQSRQYTYRYYGADRLTGASYGGGNVGENYGLSGISYDKDGNLQSLNRAGVDQLYP